MFYSIIHYSMMTSEQLDHTWVDSSQSHLQPRTYFPGFKSFGNCKQFRHQITRPDFSLYLENIHDEEVIGPPHSRAPAPAVNLSGAAVRDLVTLRGEAGPGVGGVVARQRVLGPHRAGGASAPGHIAPSEPVVTPVSPDKALLAGEVKRQPLEAFLRELLSLWTQPVLVSASVVGRHGPARMDLRSGIPGVGT